MLMGFYFLDKELEASVYPKSSRHKEIARDSASTLSKPGNTCPGIGYGPVAGIPCAY